MRQSTKSASAKSSSSTDRRPRLDARKASGLSAFPEIENAQNPIRRALRGAGIPPRKAGPRVRPEMLEAM